MSNHEISNDRRDGLTHAKAQDYPALNNTDKHPAALFQGLTHGPHSWKARNMSVVWFRVVYYIIFGLLKGSLNILCEPHQRIQVQEIYCSGLMISTIIAVLVC